MSDLTPPQKRPRRSSDRLAARLAILQRSRTCLTELQMCFSEFMSDADVFPFAEADADIRVLVSALKRLTEIAKRSPQQRRQVLNAFVEGLEFVTSLPVDPPDGTQPREVPDDFWNEAQSSASDIKPEKASHDDDDKSSGGNAVVTVDEMDSQLCEPTVRDMDSQSQM